MCTYQAISGAGKTFETWPEMVDNVIPYIGGEEEKSEREPLKLWGRVENGVIVNADSPAITAQCFRVAASNGHMAAVFASFAHKPTVEEMKEILGLLPGTRTGTGASLCAQAVPPLFRASPAVPRPDWTA